MDRPRPKAVKRYAGVTPLGDRRCLLSRRLLPRIRYEQALAETALAVFPDQSLGLGSDQEVGQCLTADDIDPGRVLRVELKHVVEFVQKRLALDHGEELQLVPPRQVGGPVGESVAVLFVGELERGAHPLARFDVPLASRWAREARALPEQLLALVRAGLVAARDEDAAPLGDLAERRHRVTQTAQPRRVARGPDDEELVVHHDATARKVPRIDQRALRLRRVRQHHVRVAAAAHRERLPAAHGDHLDGVVGLPLEHGQQAIEQPGVASRGGGGEQDLLRLELGGRVWRLLEDGGAEEHTSTNLNQPPPTSTTSLHYQRACICTMTRLLSMLGPCSLKAVYSSCSFRSSPEKKYCT